MSKRFTGDFWSIPVQLNKNSSSFSVSGASEIKAALVQVIGGIPKQIIEAKAVSESVSGSDWSNGLIVVEFTETETNSISSFQHLYLEVQVILNARKTTWPRQLLEVEKGFID